MTKIIFFDAFKFGFVSLFKNIGMLIISAFTSIGLFFGGLAISGIISIIPILFVLDKIVYSFNNAYIVFASAALSPEEKALAILVYALKFLNINYGLSIFLLAAGVFLFLALMLFFIIFIAFGWIRIATKLSRGQDISFRDLFSRPGLIIKGMGLAVITIILFCLPLLITGFVLKKILITGFVLKKSMIAGSICLIFLAAYILYVPFKMAFSSWFLIDRKMGVLEAIRSSFMLKGGLINIWLFLIMSLPILVILKYLSLEFASIEVLKTLFFILNLFLQFICSAAIIISIGYLYTNLSQDQL